MPPSSTHCLVVVIIVLPSAEHTRTSNVPVDSWSLDLLRPRFDPTGGSIIWIGLYRTCIYLLFYFSVRIHIRSSGTTAVFVRSNNFFPPAMAELGFQAGQHIESSNLFVLVDKGRKNFIVYASYSQTGTQIQAQVGSLSWCSTTISSVHDLDVVRLKNTHGAPISLADPFLLHFVLLTGKFVANCCCKQQPIKESKTHRFQHGLARQKASPDWTINKSATPPWNDLFFRHSPCSWCIGLLLAHNMWQALEIMVLDATGPSEQVDAWLSQIQQSFSAAPPSQPNCHG